MSREEFRERGGPDIADLAVGDLVDVTTEDGNFWSGRLTRVNRVTAIIDDRDFLKVRAFNFELVERKGADGEWSTVWEREDTGE